MMHIAQSFGTGPVWPDRKCCAHLAEVVMDVLGCRNAVVAVEHAVQAVSGGLNRPAKAAHHSFGPRESYMYG